MLLARRFRMSRFHRHKRIHLKIKDPFQYLIQLLLLLVLYFISTYNYLLFHGLAEVYSIIIAFGIFIVGWNCRKLLDNQYLLFLGIAYLFIAMLDLLHTFSYKGMGIRSRNTSGSALKRNSAIASVRIVRKSSMALT